MMLMMLKMLKIFKTATIPHLLLLITRYIVLSSSRFLVKELPRKLKFDLTRAVKLVRLTNLQFTIYNLQAPKIRKVPRMQGTSRAQELACFGIVRTVLLHLLVRIMVLIDS